MSDPMLGDIKVKDRVEKVENLGSAPSFFSCWDMHAYYGESYIVQGVNFDIREGEVVALLGRNGAGKTSTLRSIAGSRGSSYYPGTNGSGKPRTCPDRTASGLDH